MIHSHSILISEYNSSVDYSSYPTGRVGNEFSHGYQRITAATTISGNPEPAFDFQALKQDTSK